MNGRKFIHKIMIGIGLTFTMSFTYASPLWTYSAPNPASVTVSDGGSATVTYTVTSHTTKSKSLVITPSFPPYPPTPGLTASTCSLPHKGSTCTLTITTDGTQVPADGIHNGPYMCQSDANGRPNLNQCYRPSKANVLNIIKNTTQQTSLSVSVSQLALSVTGLREYGVSGTPSSGLARVITITNTGSNPAINLSVNQPIWPAGTRIDTFTLTACTNGRTLAASGGTCTITIVPGANATLDSANNPCSSGTDPVPEAVQVSAENANPVSSDVVVLGYGCVYQGGQVYAFDDTTPNTGSVGGKVVTISDQAAAFPDGIIWSSNGSTGGGSGGFDPVDTSYDTLPGIDERSTSATGSPTYDTFASFFLATYTNTNPFSSASFDMCNGKSDGSCNTDNILTFYNQFITNNTLANGGTVRFIASAGPTDIMYYAAGLCKQIIASYSDWYLPAICEMGYGSTACGTSGTPTLQNIQSSLIDDNNGLNAPAGEYWSSTERSDDPQLYAWGQLFASGGSVQGYAFKTTQLGVRCSRAF